MERTELLDYLEEVQTEIESITQGLNNPKVREGRRAISLAITKLDEARLWIGEAIMTVDTHGPNSGL